jgi:hypothetical protein
MSPGPPGLGHPRTRLWKADTRLGYIFCLEREIFTLKCKTSWYILINFYYLFLTDPFWWLLRFYSNTLPNHYFFTIASFPYNERTGIVLFLLMFLSYWLNVALLGIIYVVSTLNAHIAFCQITACPMNYLKRKFLFVLLGCYQWELSHHR